MKYLSLGLLLISPPLWAIDILWMNNGDRLTGVIEEITEQSVRLALPYSQAVTVKRDAIKRWRLDKQDKPKTTAKSGVLLVNYSQLKQRASKGATSSCALFFFDASLGPAG